MAEVDVEKLEDDIRTTAITRRMRPSLFFVDYDPLRSGLVSESQFFRKLLDSTSVKPHESALPAKYAGVSKDRQIEWRRSVDEISLPFDAADVTTDPSCQQSVRAVSSSAGFLVSRRLP